MPNEKRSDITITTERKEIMSTIETNRERYVQSLIEDIREYEAKIRYIVYCDRRAPESLVKARNELKMELHSLLRSSTIQPFSDLKEFQGVWQVA